MFSKNLSKRNLKVLQRIHSLPPNKREEEINKCHYTVIIAICEFALNFLSRTFSCAPPIKDKLIKFGAVLRKLAKRKKLSKDCEIERRLINQRINNSCLTDFIIPAALTYIYKNLPT